MGLQRAHNPVAEMHTIQNRYQSQQNLTRSEIIHSHKGGRIWKTVA